MIDFVRRAIIFDAPESPNGQKMKALLEECGYKPAFGDLDDVKSALRVFRAKTRNSPLKTRADELVIFAPSDRKAEVHEHGIMKLIEFCAERSDVLLPLVLYPPSDVQHKEISNQILDENKNVQKTGDVDVQHVVSAIKLAAENAHSISKNMAKVQSSYHTKA